MQKLILAAAALLGLLACRKDSDNLQNTDQVRSTYVLPGDTLFPEGIAVDLNDNVFYTGSVTNGDILKVNIATGATTVWASGASQNRAAAVGMKRDGHGRLWVCGGLDSKIWVLRPDGSVLRMYDMAARHGAQFVNDCTFDGTYMYFTDSRTQKIYFAKADNNLPVIVDEWISFSDGQIPYTDGATNANGIVHTADGRYIIVVVSSTGKLYRIGKTDYKITEIELNMPLTGGDGMVLEDNRLYVCRNAANQIHQVTLNDDYSRGTVGAGFGNGLLFCTTMARVGDYFLVVNGQLNKRQSGTQVLPFTVSRVTVVP